MCINREFNDVEKKWEKHLSPTGGSLDFPGRGEGEGPGGGFGELNGLSISMYPLMCRKIEGACNSLCGVFVVWVLCKEGGHNNQQNNLLR